MKRISAILCLIICLSSIVGCGKSAVESSSNEVNKQKVTIDGTTFSVNGKTYDIRKQDESINAIMVCTFITDAVCVLDCHINPNVSYYAIFDIESMDYKNGIYGSHSTWINDDLSSFIYTLNNIVYDVDGNELYTVKMTDTQFIYDLKYTHDGKSVSVLVSDNNPDSGEDMKTCTFDR